MHFNLPILLTWFRIAAIPLLVLIYLLPPSIDMATKNVSATVLFVLTALTDWLDGFLARRWKQESRFGAFLDPVADKLLVSSTLLILIELDRVQLWVALIIISREITVSALREWMAQLGASQLTAVNYLGKIKTILQLVSLPMLLFFNPLPLPFFVFDAAFWGSRLLEVAALMTMLSMSYYLYHARKVVRD